MNQYPTSEGNNRPSGRHPDPPTGPIHGHYDHTMTGYGAGQPPQYGYQQGPPPQGFGPPPKQGMSTGVVVLITVLVVVVIGLLVGAAFLLVPRMTGSNEAAPTWTVPVTSTVTAEQAPSDGGSAPTVQPAQPAQGSRPSGAYECWSGGSGAYESVAVGSSVTSCEFAGSVWGEYTAAGGTGQAMTVRAYSPVTGTTYTMSCSGGAVVTCTGGNNAVVHIY